jgi:phosphatidylglycerophosphate synthase
MVIGLKLIQRWIMSEPKKYSDNKYSENKDWSPIEIYKQTRRKGEYIWNTLFSRPFSSVIVYLAYRTPITPNGITFISLAWGLASAASFLFWIDMTGAIFGFIFSQMAYIFDCADGQLARMRKTSSDLGILLDFLIDEIKTYFIFAAIGLRLFFQVSSGSYNIPNWYPDFVKNFFQIPNIFIYLTVLGLVLIAVSIELTNLTRRQEYGGSLTEKGPKKRSGIIGTCLFIIEWLFQRVLHYPSTIIYYIVFDRLDLFLLFFTCAYILYALRTGLSVFMKTAFRH